VVGTTTHQLTTHHIPLEANVAPADVLPPDAPPIGDAGAPPAGPRNGPPASLLDSVLNATLVAAEQARSHLDRFLGESSPWKALGLWLGPTCSCRGPDLKERVVFQLIRDIAQIDLLLTRQTNAILHHPAFQKLEASWRGLQYLVRQAPEGENVKIRILSISWKELVRDLDRAIEFDQSQLFRKVYNEEFGTPGGEPYSLLLGDYEICPRPGPDHPTDDMAALASIASVAAAAFAPFVAGAHPAMLDLTSFTELELPLDLSRTFEQIEYLKWKGLRDREDARFAGLTMPRVLMRLPYRDDGSRRDGFRFHEEVSLPDRSQYLWGTAVYAFATVVIRAYAEYGWPAAIRGVQRGVVGGGLVTGLPLHSFRTDRTGLALKCSTDGIITDAREKELGELGFMPLCHCQDTGLSAFYGNQSVQKPKLYDELPATINARMSTMLQYMFCVARFAHYIKVITRDKVGSFVTPGDLEDYLRKWLMKYTTSSDTGGPEIKARFPLREAKVQVTERADKPGTYRSVIHLRPHYQLDQMVTSVRLVAELAAPSTAV
jgi:type VI secretion system ImpC/EvpB family protein